MPQNWKTYKLSDFIEMNPKVQLKTGQEYSFVEMKDLDANNKFVLPSVVKELKGGAKFQNGDTLFARITPCLENGKICQVKGLKNDLGFGSTEFLVFRGKEHISDSDFVYYLSRSSEFRTFAEANMIGTSGRQRVAKEAFSNLEMKLPPLSEQRAIASILSVLDDKIELNLQMNKTLEEMAMSLYKHWFVEFGPFKDGKFVKSELGIIPEGWEVKKLGEIGLDIGDGNYSTKYPSNSEFVDSGVPFIRAVNMKNGTLIRNDLRYITAEKHSTIKKGHLKKGDVLMVTRGMIGDIARVPNYFIDSNINAQLVRLNGHTILPSTYLYLILKDSKVNDRIISHKSGTALQQLPIHALNSIELLIPSEHDLKDFDKIVFDLFESVDVNNDEIHTLSKIRDYLLPKLISGEIWVKDIEKNLKEK